jgi:hypothetical protein
LTDACRPTWPFAAAGFAHPTTILAEDFFDG